MGEPLTGTALTERAAMAMRVPLSAALGVELLDPSEPAAGVRFTVGDGIGDNGVGGLHAAALGAVLELGAYLALLPQLLSDEHAVTNTVSTQLLAAGARGDRIEVRGGSAARTGRLGFVTATATGPDGIVARSQITKSIVRFAPAQG